MFFFLSGDEGSAGWISHKAVKTFYDDDDGLVRSPHCTKFLKSAIFDYFKMKEKFDILPYLYDFKKEPFARFCEAGFLKGARQGDALCLHLFYEAGFILAMHVNKLEQYFTSHFPKIFRSTPSTLS